jgi:hypothetical protein
LKEVCFELGYPLKGFTSLMLVFQSGKLGLKEIAFLSPEKFAVSLKEQF